MKKSAMLPLLGLLLCGLWTQAEPTNAISIREPWSNIFGGKAATFHVSVAGTHAFAGLLGWQLTTEGRTLARGESAITVSPTDPGEASLRIPVPMVNPGVIMQTRLSVWVANEGKTVSQFEKILWVFPEDPLADRREWLKAIRLKLFDPIGKTSKLLEELEIPYTLVRSVDALSSVKEGLVLIGEGVSFKEHRGLAAGMNKTVASGVSVLCLAPAGGEIALPSEATSNLVRPVAMAFKREGVIRDLDKRLDPDGWAPDGRSVASSMALRGDRGPVRIEVGKDANDWLWVEWAYARNNAKCVIIGFEIVGKWADSPTPRFLFVKLLESVSGNKVGE